MTPDPERVAVEQDALQPIIEMLEAASKEDGCTVFEHSAEEIGMAVMEAHNAVLARLSAQSAHPDPQGVREAAKAALNIKVDIVPVDYGGPTRLEPMVSSGGPYAGQ